LQYSRERRLEEEYAFKASISVSLNPYKDLVQAIIKEDKNAELVDAEGSTHKRPFLLSSISHPFPLKRSAQKKPRKGGPPGRPDDHPGLSDLGF